MLPFIVMLISRSVGELVSDALALTGATQERIERPSR
jgi:hypothetical protein